MGRHRENDGGADPARPLVAIMPRPVVVGLGVAGFLLAVGLLLWSLLDPARFDGWFERTVLAFGFAFVAGLLLFILYPWNYRLTKIPGLDLTVELAGPVVLVVVLTLFLRSILPAPEGGRVHRLVRADGGQSVGAIDPAGVSVTFLDVQTEPKFYPVLGANKELYALYIVYPENTTKLRARVELSSHWAAEEVTFDRYDQAPTPLRLAPKEK